MNTGQVEDRPALAELVRVFARIGCISFGGPAGQIALMQHEIVDRLGWIGQGEFLRALNLCHLLPGPEAQQLATWIGWRLHGVRGGLVAGGLFVLPGAAFMVALSLLYAQVVGLAWFAGLFLGIKAAVLAIVAQALIRVGKRTLGSTFSRVVASAWCGPPGCPPRIPIRRGRLRRGPGCSPRCVPR